MSCFAGMPLISDPGSGLVAAAAAAGYPVVPIAGPSAFLLALVASGLSSARFTFVGFLPDKPKHRQQELQDLAGAAFHIFWFNCNKPAKMWRMHSCCLAETPARSTQAAMVFADLAHTLVFYVPPHDLLDVLQDAAQVLGAERKCVVARELTKVLYSCIVADLGAVLACIFSIRPNLLEEK
jgi:16S rRNA (cytidine1402-2'-O)-methyltransferase